MRHLATIREIATLRPIAGADRIEVAQVDGGSALSRRASSTPGNTSSISKLIPLFQRDGV